MTIEELRAVLGKMNLAKVARDTEIHHNTLIRIKNNENYNPSYSVVTRLAEYLDGLLPARAEK